MLLALDDTDGPQGGCTTHVAARIRAALEPGHRAGAPRLVRLDPGNPWKTRGNAAVVLPVRDGLDPEELLDQALPIVEEHARLAEGKGAGMAVFPEAPEEAWYRRGVREHVPLEEARAALEGVPTRTLGEGRGLVGCLCAAAWRPGEQATWTRIAYRRPQRWGTPRELDPEGVRQLTDRFPQTFDCWDPHDEHPVIAPRTPCPVLYGIRATAPDRLAEAAGTIASEPEAGAVTFRTNQATDDHLGPEDLVRLTVTEAPEALEGGHVRLVGRTPAGEERVVMAFEPTGRLRAGVRAVDEGDAVLPVGPADGGQVNLEKLLHAPQPERAPQRCPGCGGRMRSMGARAPVRCARCGTRAPKRAKGRAPRWTEADPSARRHLARPLALGLAPHVAQAAGRLIDRAAAAAPA